ncbi:hypothetical protein PMm318_A53800 [Pseudomonas moorei]
MGGIHFFGNGGWRFRLAANHLEKRNAAPVGASPLAMVDNDDAGCLNARVVPAFFASRLAPTETAQTL